MSKFLLRCQHGVFTLAVVSLFAYCSASKKAGGSQQYMNEQYKELKDALNEAEVSIIKDSIKVIFSTGILFETASDQLKEDIKPAFQRFAKVLNKFDKTKIVITGHTDNTGADAFNKELSENRAKSAKALLGSYQVNNERMFTFGLGSGEPLAGNDTEQGRAKNRRVEFVILYNIK